MNRHEPLGLTKGNENPHPHPYPLPEGEGISLPFKGRDRVGMGKKGIFRWISSVIAIVIICTLIVITDTGHVDAQPHESSPITVIAASPEPNTRGTDIDTVISVTFSRNVDISSLNNTTFIVYITGEYNDMIVHGAVVYDSDTNTAYFIPDSELSYSTNYKIVVTPDIKDTEGRNLPSEYIWEFTTKNAFGGCGGS